MAGGSQRLVSRLWSVLSQPLDSLEAIVVGSDPAGFGSVAALNTARLDPHVCVLSSRALSMWSAARHAGLTAAHIILQVDRWIEAKAAQR